MNPINFAAKASEISFRIIDIVCCLRWAKDSFKYKPIISRNSRFKNIHLGETCYIIGNGPSIKNLDTTLLEGKTLFTVNAMVNTEMFQKLRPQYHCIIDRFVYQRMKDTLNEQIRNCHNTFFFLHRSMYEDCKNSSNAYFTYNTIIPTSARSIIPDITRNANIFINVLPYAINIAIFMGFKKVVLLGCDFSFFATRKDAHFYEIGKGIERRESLFEDLFGSAVACQQYGYLYEYAKAQGVTILNATPESLLDVIPQVDLNTVL